MNTLELKSNFHKLIDTINNEKILSSFYEMMSSINDHHEGSLWARLSPEEKKELIELDEETKNENNLISQTTIMEKHRKWL
ncbi:MAG TPA: hypothetical protein PLU10_13150 [Chitinophagaceae bacterium]|nr:hypothetical protein [Chitinophagaceae bacterium]